MSATARNSVASQPDITRFTLIFGLALAVLAIALLAAVPMPMAIAAAVGLLSMGCWATNALPEAVTALLFFAAAMLLALAPAPVVFSGFTSSAFWLVLSGMVVGQAITRTGLGARVAKALAQPLSKSYPQLIGGLIALSYGLSFVMPSNMGRISLLIPIVLALADHLRLPAGRKGRTGMVLAVGFSTFMLSTSILPANVPNLVMAGAAETVYGLHISYVPYLLWHAPVLGLLKGLVLLVAILKLFPDRLEPVAEEPAVKAGSALSRREFRLTVLLLVTLALWMTDDLHHIQPAWVGLAAAALCLLPGIGILDIEVFAAINFRTMFYIAGLLGLVATVDFTGLGHELGRLLLSALPLSSGSGPANFGTLVGLSSVLSLVVTANGEPALYTPMAQAISQSTGFDPLSVIMIQVIGFSTVIFPYQAPPIIVALELGGVSLAAATRLSLVTAAVSFLLLVPLNYLWWHLLGHL